MNPYLKAIDNIKYWARPEAVPGDWTTVAAKMKVLPLPRGTCFIIGPWNFPINCLLRPLVSAISAGCTAVIKPSEIAINTCRLLLVSSHDITIIILMKMI